MNKEAGGYGSLGPMAREEDLTDEQFDELCQQYAPYLPRRSEPAAPVVQDTTILQISFLDGFPVFSDDGTYDVIAADDAYSDSDRDSDSDTAVDDVYPAGDIGARPACGVAIATLPEAVAGEAAREEQCAVCMDAFTEGQKLRIPCPNSHRFHESCIFRWLTVNHVCPVCRFALPPAKEETVEDSHTDTAAEEMTVAGSDAETDEDESDETNTEVSDIASETDSSTQAEETDTGSGGEADAYTAKETDAESDADREPAETDDESDVNTESDSGSDW